MLRLSSDHECTITNGRTIPFVIVRAPIRRKCFPSIPSAQPILRRIIPDGQPETRRGPPAPHGGQCPCVSDEQLFLGTRRDGCMARKSRSITPADIAASVSARGRRFLAATWSKFERKDSGAIWWSGYAYGHPLGSQPHAHGWIPTRTSSRCWHPSITFRSLGPICPERRVRSSSHAGYASSAWCRITLVIWQRCIFQWTSTTLSIKISRTTPTVRPSVGSTG